MHTMLFPAFRSQQMAMLLESIITDESIHKFLVIHRARNSEPDLLLKLAHWEKRQAVRCTESKVAVREALARSSPRVCTGTDAAAACACKRLPKRASAVCGVQR
jgi:hypothetical protein